MKKTDDSLDLHIRVPKLLGERLKAIADEEGRSLSRQVETVLRQWVSTRREPQLAADTAALLEGRPANWESLSEEEGPPVGMSWPEWARRRAERNG